jgi:FixJ family two-component response regulator
MIRRRHCRRNWTLVHGKISRAIRGGTTHMDQGLLHTRPDGAYVVGVAAATDLVALIDDDAGVRRGLARLLRSAGFSVVAFESAEAYLEAMAEGLEHACLVADVHLPGMSGVELQDHLAAIGNVRPAILISARPEALRPDRAGRASTIALLAKPVGEEALVGALVHALGRAACTSRSTWP